VFLSRILLFNPYDNYRNTGGDLPLPVAAEVLLMEFTFEIYVKQA